VDWRVLGLAGLAGVLLTLVAAPYLPVGIDWHLTQRPAALALLSGESPYVASPTAPYAGAPWGVWVLLPLALLPESIGRAALLFIGLVFFAFVAHRLGARPWVTGAFLLSPPVLHCLLNANNDWMPLLGFVLPPPIGLFLLAVKPQMGAVVALLWLVQAWRKGGWRETARVFGPVAAALALTFLLYGFWPANAFRIASISQGWNASLWPMSIPVGLGLAVAALRKREVRYAMAASPCLSPYVLFHSWSGALAAVLARPAEALAVIVGLWLLILLRAFAP
jgi:hypothetical protein